MDEEQLIDKLLQLRTCDTWVLGEVNNVIIDAFEAEWYASVYFCE